MLVLLVEGLLEIFRSPAPLNCISRMLRLTSLAPDIIEAILRGDESNGLSLEKLRKNLPVRWEEQRKLYG